MKNSPKQTLCVATGQGKIKTKKESSVLVLVAEGKHPFLPVTILEKL